MKKHNFSILAALLLCFSFCLPAFSLPALAEEKKADLILNESFDQFTSQVPAGFIIYNKNGGEITGEQVTSSYKHSLKYRIADQSKADVSLQYNFKSSLSGQLVLETKVRAEQDNLFFPIFQLRDAGKNNVLAHLSGGKIIVGADKTKLISYTAGKWYHLCFAIDLDTGKMDVYLDKEKKLTNISFWSKNKQNQPVEVKNITSFKN